MNHCKCNTLFHFFGQGIPGRPDPISTSPTKRFGSSSDPSTLTIKFLSSLSLLLIVRLGVFIVNLCVFSFLETPRETYRFFVTSGVHPKDSEDTIEH
jgi:hypothetical protein